MKISPRDSTRLLPIGLDIFTGLLLAYIAFLIKPSKFASFISVVYIFTIIIPGLFLSGYARKACLGDAPRREKLISHVLNIFLINFIVSLFFIFFFKKQDYNFDLILYVVSFFSLASVFQPLNIIWYYIYEDKKIYLNVKILASVIRLLGGILSVAYNEIAYILFATALTQITDGFFGIRFINEKSLTKNTKTKETRASYMLYGISIGISRGVLSIIRILIERLIGSYLPTLLLFEQIFAGTAGLYEKYFLLLKSLPKKIEYFKYFWATGVFTYFLFFYLGLIKILSYQILVGLMSSLTLLPVFYMYKLIKQSGLKVVARISILISIGALLLCLVNYFFINNNLVYGLAYMIIPMFQFLIYKSYK